MLTVHKYSIPTIHGFFEIDMPERAKIISLQFQNDFPTLWAQVDSDRKMVKRLFYGLFTGETLPERYNDRGVLWKFIATLQMQNHGQLLVTHFYQDRDAELPPGC